MALTIVLKTLFDALDEESKAKCGVVDFNECAKRETELPAKQKAEMAELATTLLDAHNKQQLTVPGLFVRLEKLPPFWGAYVKSSFCSDTGVKIFPDLGTFRENAPFRAILHELIQEVEVAYYK
jgi:hypothetical protein